jgi:hypothetical protein
MSDVVANKFSYAECKVKRLAGIQAWVTNCLVAVIKIFVSEIICAAGAFSDIVSGEFNVNSAWPCTFGFVRTNEARNLIND